jgi:hypothetical protein
MTDVETKERIRKKKDVQNELKEVFSSYLTPLDRKVRWGKFLKSMSPKEPDLNCGRSIDWILGSGGSW